MTEIRMPRLGEAVTEGYLIEYYIVDGGAVTAGDLLYRVETAKAETDIEAPVSGVVRHVATVENEYPVGELIAVIDEA